MGDMLRAGDVSALPTAVSDLLGLTEHLWQSFDQNLGEFVQLPQISQNAAADLDEDDKLAEVHSDGYLAYGGLMSRRALNARRAPPFSSVGCSIPSSSIASALLSLPPPTALQDVLRGNAMMRGSVMMGKQRCRTGVLPSVGSPPASSSASESSGAHDTEVLVGPRQVSVAPWPLHDLSLPDCKKGVHHEDAGGGIVVGKPIRSGPRCTVLSDTRRLTNLAPPAKPRRPATAGPAADTSKLVDAPSPASFGSVLHLVYGPNQPCRPCTFEWPGSGSCRKSWLCEYCHLHIRERRRPKKGETPNAGGASLMKHKYRTWSCSEELKASAERVDMDSSAVKVQADKGLASWQNMLSQNSYDGSIYCEDSSIKNGNYANFVKSKLRTLTRGFAPGSVNSQDGVALGWKTSSPTTDTLPTLGISTADTLPAVSTFDALPDMELSVYFVDEDLQ